MVLFGAPVLLFGCSRAPQTDKPVDLMGDRRESGDPLWLPDSEAWLAAETPGDAASNLIALSAHCPKDGARVGWCTAADVFICETCSSEFDRLGSVTSGVSQRGLDRFAVTVDSARNVIVDRQTITPGRLHLASTDKPTNPQCQENGASVFPRTPAPKR
jgi:hypothetical protein